MTSFISLNAQTVTIDGSAPGAKTTRFYDGESAVQLRRARNEESGFNWFQKITNVVAKDVLIYDDIDIKCLSWFIHNGIKIDFSKAYVSPDAVDGLVEECESLKKRNIKVVDGSSITIPFMNGYSGMGRTDSIKSAFQSIGFQTSF